MGLCLSVKPELDLLNNLDPKNAKKIKGGIMAWWRDLDLASPPTGMWALTRGD